MDMIEKLRDVGIKKGYAGFKELILMQDVVPDVITLTEIEDLVKQGLIMVDSHSPIGMTIKRFELFGRPYSTIRLI